MAVTKPKCRICGKEIEPFAQFWLREPDRYNTEGFAVERGRAMPFCSLGCVFGWSGKMLREQKKARDRKDLELTEAGEEEVNRG